MDKEQLVQAVAQALQQGTDPQQIVQALVKDGMPEEDAVKLVQQVAQQMQQQGGGEEGQQQEGKKYSAEQAFKILQENQINPEHVMIMLDVLMNTPQEELGKVIQAIQGGGQQQQSEGQQGQQRPERPEAGEGRRRQYNL